MYKIWLLVAAEFIFILFAQHAAQAQRRSHIGDIAVNLSESGSGTIEIGGPWGLNLCPPNQLEFTLSDGDTIDLAIEIPDGDILCAEVEEWSLSKELQFVDEHGEPFRPAQFQLDASFYVDNVTTGERKLISGPFSLYEEPPSAPVAYRMTGRVLDSISLVQPDFELPPEINSKFDGWGVEVFGAPAEFYLKVNAIDDWSFALSLLAGEVPLATHVVSPRGSYRYITKNHTDIDLDQLQVSFADSHGLFERFDLDVDLESGMGTWDWYSDCPVCDLLYALPAANGTIETIERAPIFEFDCSLDGRVSYADLYCSNDSGSTPGLLEELGLLPGDLDGNGTVAFADFLTLAKNFGPYPRTYPDGNIDGDDRIGMSDFLILAKNFNRSLQGVANVPEPTHAGLLLLAIFLVSLKTIHRMERVAV